MSRLHIIFCDIQITIESIQISYHSKCDVDVTLSRSLKLIPTGAVELATYIISYQGLIVTYYPNSLLWPSNRCDLHSEISRSLQLKSDGAIALPV